jgi:hypothetical protein
VSGKQPTHVTREGELLRARCEHCGAEAELVWRPDALSLLRPFLALHQHAVAA